jgi:hypothetical protein
MDAQEIDEILRLKHELKEARAEVHAAFQHCAHMLEEASASNGRIIYALDRGVQLIELLIAFLPEGQPTHPGLETARAVFEQALRDIRR